MILPLSRSLRKGTLACHDRPPQIDYVSGRFVFSFAGHRRNGRRHDTGPAGRSIEEQPELLDFGDDPPCAWLGGKDDPESAYMGVWSSHQHFCLRPNCGRPQLQRTNSDMSRRGYFASGRFAFLISDYEGTCQ